MTRAAAVIVITGLAACFAANGQAPGQPDGRQSFGVISSYSPSSSHILIGNSQQRRTFTLGVEYARRVWGGEWGRIDYSGEFSPLFRESDPTLVAAETVLAGSTVITPLTPTRVITVSHAPIGSSCVSTCSPIYPVYGHDEQTYAEEISPIGARVVLRPHHWLQPTFGAGLGVVLSFRDIPVDGAAQFNYEFFFGPGIQISQTERGAFRLEYIYRHISNANTGNLNPGIDQGVFRLTLSRYR